MAESHLDYIFCTLEFVNMAESIMYFEIVSAKVAEIHLHYIFTLEVIKSLFLVVQEPITTCWKDQEMFYEHV